MSKLKRRERNFYSKFAVPKLRKMSESEYTNFNKALDLLHDSYDKVYFKPYDYFVPIPSSNYSVKNRTPDDIHGVVIHTTEGWRPPYRTFSDPERQASSHYSVERDGTVVQMVEEKDVSWHAGTGANNWTVGIEVTGFTVDDGQSYAVGDPIGFGMTQIRALAKLVANICKRNGLYPSRRTVFAHAHVGGCKHNSFVQPDSGDRITPYNPAIKGTGGGGGCHYDVGNDFPWTRFMILVLWFYWRNTILFSSVLLGTAGVVLYKKKKLPKPVTKKIDKTLKLVKGFWD